MTAVIEGAGQPGDRGPSAQHAREAAAKVLAAYDAGCRRFDAALGGLGGCPFAQDELIGNIPTEEVIRALAQRGVKLSIRGQLEKVMAINDSIGREFSA